jgi:TolB protein
MADKVLQPTAAPPMRLAWVLLIALLVVALAAVAVVGARLFTSTSIPQGGTAVFTFGSISGQSTAKDILTVRADGTDLRQLTSGPAIKSHPAFSPDGTRIAYRSWENGTDSIVVIDAGGGHPTTLATSRASQEDCIRGVLAWSPNGKSLIFPTDPFCDSQADLLIVATDGSSPATRLIAAGTNSTTPHWSSDGKRIAFLGSEAGGSIGTYVADVGSDGARSGGLQARRIGPGPAGLLQETAVGPQWSPDGRQLVSANETGGIYVMQADGSDQRVVAEPRGGAEPIWAPTWSPNGQQLAYYQGVDPAERLDDRPCTVRTWIIDSDGTDMRRLEPIGDGCDLPVSWSPDGTRLAVLLIDMADPSHPFHLSMITLDGSEPVVTLQDATSGSWQPVAAPLPPPPSLAASPAP